MLTKQYRMHKKISMFSSNYFYDGRIKNGIRPEEKWAKENINMVG